MDRFAGGLMKYITDAIYSKNGKIYKPKVDYSLPNEKYIINHWQEVSCDLRYLKPLREYSDELKEVARQYKKIFLEEYPQYVDATCLKI